MLALIKNGIYQSQHSVGSRIDTHDFVDMGASAGRSYGEYSLHEIATADLIPDDKQVISTTVQNIGGSWKYVHVLADIIPPTPEEHRAQMSTLSSRQFWLAANTLGITEDLLLAATDDPEIIIEIRKTTEFHRTYDSVVMLAPLMGITPEQLDDVWLWAAAV